MSDISKVELESIMAKVAPNWQRETMPRGKTAGAFREYTAFVIMKMLIHEFEKQDPPDRPGETSVKFKITRNGNGQYRLLCGGEGWVQNMYVDFDNS